MVLPYQIPSKIEPLHANRNNTFKYKLYIQPTTIRIEILNTLCPQIVVINTLMALESIKQGKERVINFKILWVISAFSFPGHIF